MHRQAPTRVCLALLWSLAAAPAHGGAPTAEQNRFFETSVRPLLSEHCTKCHGPKRQAADLRLDSRDGILKGGESGPAVQPGHPEKSLLIMAVRHADESLKMPPDRKLSERQVADLARWVAQGLPYPQDQKAAEHDPQRFWAFQPPADPPVPAVKDTDWPRSPLDHFVLAGLEERGLRPAPPADRVTYIRRVTFDLLGLPPTPEEIDAFVNDRAPDAFEKLVDRLLASPHYGERWARHWLDVARYADSNGLDENVAYGNAWRYRDYVVAAFNQDKPYDRFLLEQLAGDLLPADGPSARATQLIATGFLSLGPKVLAEVDERKMEMDIVDEQIDTVGRSLLGLTLGCARCHDHKFDPLEIEDYYGLAGIFKSTRTMESFTKIARWHENPLPPEAGPAVPEAPPPKKSGKRAPTGPTALGVTEGPVADVPVHLRGNHLRLGKIIPRRVPTVLAGPQPPSFGKQSGRLELARWLVRPDHPLTARVMVNRLWRWHFGQGIVRTPDNFGRLGEPPVNPALLDWLARRFVAGGWSVRNMHRLLLLSSTYRMSAAADARTLEADPENRLHSRAPVRRLEAEALRDALLAVSGQLDRTPGGPVLHVKNREFLFDHTSKDATKYDSRRRSHYLPVIRNNVYDVFQLFDFPDPAVPNGDRATTTVAPQALFLMNSAWVSGLCEKLAEDLLADGSDEAARVRRLYRRAYGRDATAEEVAAAGPTLREFEQAFVAQETDAGKRRLRAWAAFCQVIVSANEFVYVR